MIVISISDWRPENPGQLSLWNASIVLCCSDLWGLIRCFCGILFAEFHIRKGVSSGWCAVWSIPQLSTLVCLSFSLSLAPSCSLCHYRSLGLSPPLCFTRFHKGQICLRRPMLVDKMSAILSVGSWGVVEGWLGGGGVNCMFLPQARMTAALLSTRVRVKSAK